MTPKDEQRLMQAKELYDKGPLTLSVHESTQSQILGVQETGVDASQYLSLLSIPF